MLNTKSKDVLNHLLSMGYSEVSRQIGTNEIEKAKSLLCTFSSVSLHGESPNYDWQAVLWGFRHHYEKHPLVKGQDKDFLALFEALRKAS